MNYILSDMNALLYRHKKYETLLGFVNSKDSPGKEIQPFRLTFMLYHAARLGFRKKLTDQCFLSETLARNE